MFKPLRTEKEQAPLFKLKKSVPWYGFKLRTNMSSGAGAGCGEQVSKSEEEA
jgi:hypothetical protein